MFEQPINYPCAIADQTDEGAEAALQWLIKHMKDGEELTLWVVQKRVLDSNDFLRNLVKYEGKGLKIVFKVPIYRANGPVLVMYPNIENLAYSTGAEGITALAVVQWVDQLEIWAKEVNAEIVHTLKPEVDWRSNCGMSSEPELTPEIIEGLQRITSAINHSNTIAGSGYDKDETVRVLLQLHDAGIELPAKRMAEWAIAHGWRSDNPKELMTWAKKINSGTRPRISRY